MFFIIFVFQVNALSRRNMSYKYHKHDASVIVFSKIFQYFSVQHIRLLSGRENGRR